ncbi:MAG: tRNA (adenosine(37)-N6)-threonylcarbamoyltransferase complex ATPase subunit type 1 TsaE [Coriobacteriales bacterium]|nr:tRNA (adenosine(37)-N6)-threonylcarbamoyltransferase complex ATPase subunit type 1 TsaE [Actinomycetes bacterium]
MPSGFTTRSARETRNAGAALAPLLRAGDVIALSGDLGAGKTQLVQGIARGLGVESAVTSPTFNLLMVHRGGLPLYHFDLYRLEHVEELDDIGFYETLESDGVSVIEWGDRFSHALPAAHLLVVIHRRTDDVRDFELVPHGERAGQLASAWVDAVETQGHR